MANLIKNIEHSKVFELVNLVGYEKGKVASLTLSQRPGVSMTLLAFDEGEGVSTHAAPGDAMVVILDGEAEVTIDKEVFRLKAGETIILPSSIPHGVKSITKFKMLLTLVRETK